MKNLKTFIKNKIGCEMKSKAAKFLSKKYKQEMKELNKHARTLTISLHSLKDDEIAIYSLKNAFRDNRLKFQYIKQELDLLTELDSFVK